jgi:hypothetical protein
VCAALGFGSAISIIKENSPLSGEIWGQIMEITSSCLNRIAKLGGPRCCKRDTYLSILEGTNKLKEILNIHLHITQPKCGFSSLNAQCKKSSCPFYNN